MLMRRPCDGVERPSLLAYAAFFLIEHGLLQRFLRERPAAFVAKPERFSKRMSELRETVGAS